MIWILNDAHLNELILLGVHLLDSVSQRLNHQSILREKELILSFNYQTITVIFFTFMSLMAFDASFIGFNSVVREELAGPDSTNC